MSETPEPRDEGDATAAESVERRGTTQEDPRLAQIAQEYLAELEAGRRPNRRLWLDRFPELADSLAECLDGLEFVYRASPLASPLSDDAPRPAAVASDASASPLGDFQILQEIGRGGMGIVYEATQMSLGRRVALKVLPFAATFDAKHLQRFRQEAQAAAQLHHTNIVPVYAVGCERGIHFYAMQLIEGQSLDAIVRQLRQQVGLGAAESESGDGCSKEPHRVPPVDNTEAWPAGASTTSQAATRFSAHQAGKGSDAYRAIARCMAQAAEGLEYAHQQGIVHRDVKPANLLIDARGNPWITDFGLAHFHDAPALTQTGDILGTIRYMSPEQASGQRVVLDHRTDIYSLAATFYELLTLRPVFAGATRHALLTDVLRRDPRPPRSIDRNIPTELALILMKALNKNPADRYATAQDLADDLHRFLRDEPIRAKRPSLAEHARKWSRRHPSIVVAGVVVMFLGLLISLVSTWRITKAQDETRAALAQERLRAEEAERSFQQARKAVDFLIEIGQNDLSDAPPLQGLRRRVLEAALDYYQGFIAQRRDDPSSQSELLAVQERLRKVLDDLSVLEGAGRLIRLSNHDVQTDLGMDQAQRSKIATMTESFDQRQRELLRTFGQLSPTERRDHFLELARADDQAIRALLTDAQLRRLEQIQLQLEGPRAFVQPEVVKRLQLSDAQRQTIQQIQMEAFALTWDMPRPDRRRPPNGPLGGPRDGPTSPVMGKIVDLLTPEQLEAWNQLIGPPFKGSVEPMRPGPGRGPGPPPHGPPGPL